MDNPKAKLILSVYRANGQDAQDPLFQEALKQAEADPALRAWLEEQQDFDTKLAAAFAGVRGPAEGKAMVKVTMGSPARRTPRWVWALAASVLLLLGLTFGLRTRPGLVLPEGATLAEMAADLSDHHASIGLVSMDMAKVKTWLAQNGGPLPDRLPPGLEKMALLGCQAWDTNHGKISLVCFIGNDRTMVHLYVFEQTPASLAGSPLPGFGQPRREHTGDWDLAVWQDQGHGYVLGVPSGSNQGPGIESFFKS
jgi:hypothetical protein